MTIKEAVSNYRRSMLELEHLVKNTFPPGTKVNVITKGPAVVGNYTCLYYSCIPVIYPDGSTIQTFVDDLSIA